MLLLLLIFVFPSLVVGSFVGLRIALLIEPIRMLVMVASLIWSLI
jgi:hypothetical protein